jgi:hypothetical protein
MVPEIQIWAGGYAGPSLVKLLTELENGKEKHNRKGKGDHRDLKSVGVGAVVKRFQQMISGRDVIRVLGDVQS